MIALIVVNGPGEGFGPWENQVRQARLVVAADGGARRARALGLVPHALVGDADSLDEETARWLEEQGAARVQHPRAKDETDLELALLHAVEAGADEILVLGAWGGRPDQSIANLQLLAHPRLAGRVVRLLGSTYQMFLLHGGEGRTITGRVGDTVSLLPLNGDARGICTAGLRWKLDGETLSFGPARGISNEMTAPLARVSVEEGLLLVVHLVRAPWTAEEKT
jgi:thiamine pyrophosphokinase